MTRGEAVARARLAPSQFSFRAWQSLLLPARRRRPLRTLTVNLLLAPLSSFSSSAAAVPSAIAHTARGASCRSGAAGVDFSRELANAARRGTGRPVVLAKGYWPHEWANLLHVLLLGDSVGLGSYISVTLV